VGTIGAASRPVCVDRLGLAGLPGGAGDRERVAVARPSTRPVPLKGGELLEANRSPSSTRAAPEHQVAAGAGRDIRAVIASLAAAALALDHDAVRHNVARLANAYDGPDRQQFAAELRALLKRTIHPVSTFPIQRLPIDPKSRLPLLEEEPWPSEPLLLEEMHERALKRFVTEAAAARQLAEAGLASRANLLLVGPPGTGKTLIAGHVAARLQRPMRMVRLDALVSSLLGDTAKNIRAVFDSVGESGFLFLDEMDAIAKKRDDVHEVGELKRVVNTLLQGLDSLGTGAVIVAATNHPHLLDPAIWRRFPTKITVELPSPALRASLWKHYLQLRESNDLSAWALARLSEGLSGSDIRELALSALRDAFLTNSQVAFSEIVATLLGSHQGAGPPAAAHADASWLVERSRERGLSQEELAALGF
jgi:hypothetical protein